MARLPRSVRPPSGMNRFGADDSIIVSWPVSIFYFLGQTAFFCCGLPRSSQLHTSPALARANLTRGALAATLPPLTRASRAVLPRQILRQSPSLSPTHVSSCSKMYIRGCYYIWPVLAAVFWTATLVSPPVRSCSRRNTDSVARSSVRPSFVVGSRRQCEAVSH